MEFFIAWYSGVIYEQYVFVIGRALGPYAWAYWTMVTCNVIIPQLLWFKKVRRNIFLMYPIVILVNVGMWFERFVIIATSLFRDYLPSSWSYFSPTLIDGLLFIGSFGIFLTLLLLFCRLWPTIAVAEVKAIVPGAQPHGHHDHHDSVTDAMREAPSGESEEIPLKALNAAADTAVEPETTEEESAAVEPESDADESASREPEAGGNA
jgi:molybdopterin-containing oxidoreductase family membrane subunit